MSLRTKVLEWLQAGDKVPKAGARRKSWDSIFLRGKSAQDSAGLSKPYAQHSVVYQAVNIISSNIASTPFIFYRGDEQIVDPKHPLDQLMDRPNPTTSRFQLFQSTGIHLQLDGEAFWVIIKSVGQALQRPGAFPAELYVADPKKMKEVVSDQGEITGWVFDGRIPFELEEVIHMKRYNPYNPHRGLSPLSAARMAMETDWQAQIYNREFFKNDGTPGGVLEVPGEEPLRDDEFNRLRAQFQNKYAGAENAHKLMILSEGMKYKPMSITHIDMDFINQRQFSRDEILAVFGVPKTVAGYTEGINRATAEMQRKNFWVETLLPQMTLIEQAIAHRLIIPHAPDIQGFFDRDAIEELRPDLKNKTDIADKLWRLGVPFEQINDRLDLGFQEFIGWDTSWLGFNVTPADPTKQIGGSSPTREEQEEAAVASLDDADEKQAIWTDKLSKKLSRYLFEQRLQVLKDEVDWEEQEANLVKLVSPIFAEIYKEAPMLLGPRLNKICGMNTALKRQVETDASSNQIKEIYNQATKRVKTIARFEIQTAFDEMAALSN